jgi:hypothetical protein
MIVLLGVILEATGDNEGPSAGRTYRVRWHLPEGGTLELSGCRTREYEAGETLERRAFAVGFPVLGAMTSQGARPAVIIMDREDYAVGCEGAA